MQRQIYRLRHIVKDSRERKFKSRAVSFHVRSTANELYKKKEKKENRVEEEIKKKRGRKGEREDNCENKIVASVS